MNNYPTGAMNDRNAPYNEKSPVDHYPEVEVIEKVCPICEWTTEVNKHYIDCTNEDCLDPETGTIWARKRDPKFIED